METEIFVALIAGVVSFLGLVISKEQKISELRLVWINALRDDIAELLSEINNFELKYQIEKKELNFDGVEFIKKNIEATNKLRKFSTRIRLRLNPNDSDGLLSVLDKLDKVITNPSLFQESYILDDILEKFETKSHEILKNEWERVKRGESWFIVSKWIVSFVLVCIVIIFLKI